MLEIMIEQQENHLRTQERLLLNLMLKRGQMLEYYKKVDAAMEVYVYVLSRARRVIAECREHLGVEQKGVGNRFTSLKNEGKGKGKEKVVEVGYVVGEEGGGEVTQNEAPTGHPFNHGAWRLRLRSFLEVEHAASFFIGSIYFQMKTEQEKLRNESLVSEYGQKETEFYERAKSMRKEVLYICPAPRCRFNKLTSWA